MKPEEHEQVWRTLRKYRDAAHEAEVYSQWQRNKGRDKFRTKEEELRRTRLSEICHLIDEAQDLIGKRPKFPLKEAELMIDKVRQALWDAGVKI